MTPLQSLFSALHTICDFAEAGMIIVNRDETESAQRAAREALNDAHRLIAEIITNFEKGKS